MPLALLAALDVTWAEAQQLAPIQRPLGFWALLLSLLRLRRVPPLDSEAAAPAAATSAALAAGAWERCAAAAERSGARRRLAAAYAPVHAKMLQAFGLQGDGCSEAAAATPAAAQASTEAASNAQAGDRGSAEVRDEDEEDDEALVMRVYARLRRAAQLVSMLGAAVAHLGRRLRGGGDGGGEGELVYREHALDRIKGWTRSLDSNAINPAACAWP